MRQRKQTESTFSASIASSLTGPRITIPRMRALQTGCDRPESIQVYPPYPLLPSRKMRFQTQSHLNRRIRLTVHPSLRFVATFAFSLFFSTLFLLLPSTHFLLTSHHHSSLPLPWNTASSLHAPLTLHHPRWTHPPQPHSSLHQEQHPPRVPLLLPQLPHPPTRQVTPQHQHSLLSLSQWRMLSRPMP